MKHIITTELLAPPPQRAELGRTDDRQQKLRNLYEKFVDIAVSACLYPGTDNDLPSGVRMSGEHTMSSWNPIGIDATTSSTIMGRLHLSKGSVAMSPHSWVLAESKLFVPETGSASSASEIVSTSGWDNGEFAEVSLGARPDRVNLYHVPMLFPMAEDVAERFEVVAAHQAVTVE